MYIKQIGINYIHNEFYKAENPDGNNYFTLLLLKSPAIFTIKNTNYEAKRNSIIIYESFTPQFYCATDEILVFDRIQFGIENGTDFFKALNIPMNTVLNSVHNENLSDILRLLLNEFYSTGSRKLDFTDCMLKALFIKISESVNADASQNITGPYYNKLVEIRKKIYSNPCEKWTVDALSKEVNLSRSYFQLLYRETFGVTCITDVIECKINFAKYSLANTTHTVSCIAEMCGYDNDVHFMRQFKKIVGVTPSEYRKRSAINGKK